MRNKRDRSPAQELKIADLDEPVVTSLAKKRARTEREMTLKKMARSNAKKMPDSTHSHQRKQTVQQSIRIQK